MDVSGLNHYTLRCTLDELQQLTDFYTRVLKLQPGDRPVMPAPGRWMYSEGRPVVHLYAGQTESLMGPTAALDHISFTARGLDSARAELTALGVSFEELPVAGWPLYQLFFKDPIGLKIELTFDLNAEAEQSVG